MHSWWERRSHLRRRRKRQDRCSSLSVERSAREKGIPHEHMEFGPSLVMSGFQTRYSAATTRDQPEVSRHVCAYLYVQRMCYNVNIRTTQARVRALTKGELSEDFPKGPRHSPMAPSSPVCITVAAPFCQLQTRFTELSRGDCYRARRRANAPQALSPRVHASPQKYMRPRCIIELQRKSGTLGACLRRMFVCGGNLTAVATRPC
ncbi:uncharacterized protein EI90DRAFT_1487499 [Cantharellus anzutake]|uniref:uncharacterized protein n=1 Tax=Cantharellus anzutake TaxID=1750568 RepID=UPI001907BD8F|nr:uncharacterized protein EI90DRAFT_1487499 [Cantharellus anzutake]KAF8328888.1 hypothetical protein EI90DRAFT_1487499 [Cantharellus anzutake]